MGNSIVGRKTAKVMKIDGETFKLKTPKRVWDVIKDHPGHVLLDSEAVKHFGIRAKPLESDQELKPRRVYFLVDLPRFPVEAEENKRAPRRVRSAGIQMSAKERLECLMLSRRTSSDLSLVRAQGDEGGGQRGGTRVKMRMSKGEMARLVEESKDEKEVAEKIMKIYKGRGGGGDGGMIKEDGVLTLKETWRPSLAGNGQGIHMSLPPQKHVRFDPVEDGGEIQAFISTTSAPPQSERNTAK